MARALLSPLGPLALLTLLALPSPVRAARPDATAAAPDPGKAGKTAPTEADAGAEIEIVVEKSRPDWLFPHLDHPRVQAFFRSGSSVGPSLFDPEQGPSHRPLVRAGMVRVRGTEERSTRRAARRFARELVAEVRPALEACYVDVLQRSPTDAVQLTLQVRLDGPERGPVHLAAGTLGDVYGNACVLGVLEFAETGSPNLGDLAVEIPVWFWLQEV